MKDLTRILKDYACGCSPKFATDNKPFLSHYEMEFEDYMYSAFIISET